MDGEGADQLEQEIHLPDGAVDPNSVKLCFDNAKGKVSVKFTLKQTVQDEPCLRTLKARVEILQKQKAIWDRQLMSVENEILQVEQQQKTLNKLKVKQDVLMKEQAYHAQHYEQGLAEVNAEIAALEVQLRV